MSRKERKRAISRSWVVDAPVGLELVDAVEPGVLAPLPHPRGGDVGEHEGEQQLGEDEDLHVGEGDGGRVLLDLVVRAVGMMMHQRVIPGVAAGGRAGRGKR
jgi:hypothetical protein